MECPKCGVPQADGLEECSSCGIVFDRWRMARDRDTLTSRSTEVRFEAAERGLPRWMVAVALLAVVGLGAVWTVRMRQARAKRRPVRELVEQANAANRQGLAVRQSMTEAEAAARRQHYLAQKRVNEQSLQYLEVKWPDGLTEEMAREMLAGCYGFMQAQVDTVPATFPDLAYTETVRQYPSLFTGLKEGFFVLDPPLDEIKQADSVEQYRNTSRTIWVRPTSAGLGALGITEATDKIEIDLGRRRLDAFKRIYPTFAGTKLEFYWQFERPGGLRLRGVDRLEGWIEVVQDGRTWRLRDGVVDEGKGDLRVCG